MMTMETLRVFFAWMCAINLALLLLTTVMIVAMRGTVTKIHASMFGLDEKDLGRAYFQYVAQYKIAVIVFAIVPYIALRIMA
jgi:hypothetical protein